MTRAYSYQRFSTPDQLKGDSLRRQTEAAQKYADGHGLELDTELAFQDLGVSAFRGANFEAALGRFIEAVDSGRVPRGSYLLVENLDRLSRDKIMPALNRFQSLLEKGIIVVTLADEKRYDADSLNNLPDLMLSLLVMSRAHEESATKSRRNREAWKQLKGKAQGDPIEDYFPAIIDKATFYNLQKQPKGASGYKGGPLLNVLTGLLRCSLCGGPVHYVSKGQAGLRPLRQRSAQAHL